MKILLIVLLLLVGIAVILPATIAVMIFVFNWVDDKLDDLL
jgi:hypothetical protein